MSISIYYTAVRATDLTEVERDAVAAVKGKYSVNDLLVEYLRTRTGPNWSSFVIYDPPLLHGAIIEGATNLPDNSEEAIWIGVQHWCEALSELRRLVPDAAWNVHVDNHDIRWDETRQVYDPTT